LIDPLVVVRAVHFASTATFVGFFFFSYFIGEPALRSSPCASNVLRKHFLTLGWISLLLAVSSSAAWVLLLALDLAGHSWDTLVSQAISWKLLAETQFGNDAIVRLGLAALLSICLFRFDPERGWRSRWDGPPAVMLAGCLAGSLAWAGHGGSGSGAPGELQLAADAFHSVVAAAWIGGLPPVLLLLTFARRNRDEHWLAMAADATRRFSLYGLISVCVLLATGIINTYFLVGSVAGLVGTDYGQLLIAKIALFAAMVSFAAANRFRYVPRLLVSGKPQNTVFGRIERNGLIELCLGVVVLLIVGILGTMPPAVHAQAWWPFPLRLSTDAIFEAGSRLELISAMAAIAIGMLAGIVAIANARWRWPMLATAFVLLVWGGPNLKLLTTQAFPTSFFVSPTGYSAHSIATGRALFAEHCAACHGSEGRGDGPAAKNLLPPPADLTAEHIYDHSDGDLFWWITHGIGEAMPGFGGMLDEIVRWNLIDFIHANADARRLETADDATASLRVPEFSVECPDGSYPSISQLSGQIIHLVFVGAQRGNRLNQLHALGSRRVKTIVIQTDGSEEQQFCGTRDRDVIASLAVYRGSDAIDGTEFLVDTSGRLRSMWYPGVEPDWREASAFTEEVETIAKTPGQPQSASVHIHAH
jgi:putative copper export protein/mono/diheme cytochrome c family protein